MSYSNSKAFRELRDKLARDYKISPAMDAELSDWVSDFEKLDDIEDLEPHSINDLKDALLAVDKLEEAEGRIEDLEIGRDNKQDTIEQQEKEIEALHKRINDLEDKLEERHEHDNIKR